MRGALSRNGGRTRHYRDLLVWQKAMGLTKNICSLTESLPQKETIGLQSQIRRAAVSVPSNIAEGHGRLDDGHFWDAKLDIPDVIEDVEKLRRKCQEKTESPRWPNPTQPEE